MGLRTILYLCDLNDLNDLATAAGGKVGAESYDDDCECECECFKSIFELL